MATTPRPIALVLLLLGLIGLALAWRWTPMGDWLRPDRAVDTLRGWGGTLGPWLAVPALSALLVLAVPLSLLTLLSMVALGPGLGTAVIVGSALASAAFSQMLGRWLGHALLRRLGGPAVNRVSERLARRGLLAVVVIRLLPLAPFAIVNMVVGTTHVRLRDMLLGTAIGMAPSTIAMAVFTEQFLQALQQPGTGHAAWIALTATLILAAAWGLRRWLQRRDYQP